jgi:transcriptional regulator with XRE-family HTH domain
MLTPNDRWVGQRIASARKVAALTTRQLADRLGWNDHTRIVNYENGRRSVSVVTLMEIAGALSLPVAALLVESSEERAVIAMVAGNRERAQQLAYLMTLLNEPEPDAPENVSASDAAPVDTPGQRV